LIACSSAGSSREPPLRHSWWPFRALFDRDRFFPPFVRPPLALLANTATGRIRGAGNPDFTLPKFPDSTDGPEPGGRRQLPLFSLSCLWARCESCRVVRCVTGVAAGDPPGPAPKPREGGAPPRKKERPVIGFSFGASLAFLMLIITAPGLVLRCRRNRLDDGLDWSFSLCPPLDTCLFADETAKPDSERHEPGRAASCFTLGALVSPVGGDGLFGSGRRQVVC